jgi:hypothetical protein
MTVAIAPIRLPNEGGNVKIDKLMKLKSQRGMNKVVSILRGFFEIGI